MSRRTRPLDGIDEDIRDHIERETQDNLEKGMAPEEARRQALLRFGNVALAKEDTRAVWVSVMAEQLLQDVRYALGSVRRHPGFAAVAVLTLAVAIGMNTAMFSVFNAVVLRPLGYPSPDRLVWLSTVGMDGESGLVTGPDFVDWRDAAQSFDRMVAYGNADHTLTSAHGATRVRAAMVTADFWDLSGATPAAGRLPGPEDRQVVLLSHDFARRWFAGDADVIGKTITLGGLQVPIIGVLADGFRFHFPGSHGAGFRPREVDIYHPMLVSAARTNQVQLLNVVARLKTGTTLEHAHAEVDAIRKRIAQAHPSPLDDQRTLRVVPLHDQLIGGAGRGLRVLLGAVACVLLIACANVANLLLARASIRRREIAVRVALGAGRGRVLQQLLVETLVLAGLGSAAGLLIAPLGVAVILGIDPQAIPRLAETTIDGRVLVVVLGTSVLTALLFGLAPAPALWRMDPYDALKAGNRVASPGVTSVRTRMVLVAGEVALALVLLIGAGLLLNSAWRLNAYPAGFEPQRILTAGIELAGPQYSQPQRQFAFADALLGRLQHVPGVEAASISTHGSSLTAALMVEGEPRPTLEELARKAPIVINATSAGLKQVMGFRMVTGRWFTDAEPAAVLNETLMRRDFSGADPIGRRIRLSESAPMLTIVGVVADLKYSTLDAPAEPEVYVPYTRVEDGLFGFTALVLGTTDPQVLAPTIRTVISDIDKTQVPTDMESLEQALTESIAPRRLNLVLFGTFAAAALFLALVGIYGVMAYSVAQRTHEIGVRIALGAQRTDILRMTVRQGMRVTLAGIIAGIAGALALTRLMESLLYEVQPTDLLTFAVVTAALATTGFFACCLPGLKAALVDPVITLRNE
jgi:predicted permease